MEPKLSVSTDKELLRIGADVIVLEDESTATYKTDDLGEFTRFAVNWENPLEIFYSAEMVTACRPETFMNPRGNDPVAECKMSVHPRLAVLQSINGKTLSADDFETLLRKMRRNMGAAGLELLDNLRNLTISKATKVERKKDKGGNYRYLVSRESAGTEDFVPAETVTFSVPLFVGVEEPRPLEFDFRFDFQQKGEDVQMQFTLESLNLVEDLIYARAAVLENVLSERLPETQHYRGELSRKIKDTSWRSKVNGINL